MSVNSKLTRRRFIKGTIFSGAAVTTGTGFYLANAQSGQSAAERLITLNINGRSRPVDVMPSETLAYTLRYKLDLTGTKIGCNRGECGACTVLIDGVPNYSCSVLTHNVKDKAVISIEGVKAADARCMRCNKHSLRKTHPSVVSVHRARLCQRLLY